MPIAHIYPSQYDSYNLTISNPSNMLTPVDSTTYATLTASSNSSYGEAYLDLYDFNSETIPINAVVNSFSVKLKYESNNLVVPSGYSHAAGIYISGDFDFNGSTVDLSTLNTYNMPLTGYDLNENPITLTPDGLKDYLVCEDIGDGYSGLHIFITIPPSIYYYPYTNKVYGAEVEVDYLVPSNSKIFNMILPKGE